MTEIIPVRGQVYEGRGTKLGLRGYFTEVRLVVAVFRAKNQTQDFVEYAKTPFYRGSALDSNSNRVVSTGCVALSDWLAWSVKAKLIETISNVDVAFPHDPLTKYNRPPYDNGTPQIPMPDPDLVLRNEVISLIQRNTSRIELPTGPRSGQVAWVCGTTQFGDRGLEQLASAICDMFKVPDPRPHAFTRITGEER